MEEAEPQEEEDELPMYQEHYNALFSMDFVETSTHMMTHEDLGSLRMWSWCSRTCAWKFFSHRMESYKELTCEFLASMRYTSSLRSVWVHYGEGTYGTSRKKNSKEYGLQSLKRVLFLKVQGCQIRSPVLEICPQGSCQHLLCKESHWTINEGEVKLLDMGIKPIISRTRMGRRSEEIGHTQGISCLSLSSSLLQVTAYNTTPKGRKLSVGGINTNLCAARSQVDKRRSTPPGWMDIKFCKTNLLIEHKELDGIPIQVHTSTAGPSKLLLPNPELTTV
ncbi:unnamed protein product [Microthlaspi erraticum]|uniref:Arabidopsis retrotransposon Orf1 C-terminal domain-containing protein n=1 Tax=Microthlaspi erraticum TaxID=1685480 RepID=A0A6D2JW57_9BRAS|nr:unnamed protein product [Microthlaspi erraticum]